MSHYEIETEHYNRKNEKIDIQAQSGRIKEIISELISRLSENQGDEL